MSNIATSANVFMKSGKVYTLDLTIESERTAADDLARMLCNASATVKLKVCNTHFDIVRASDVDYMSFYWD